MERCECFRERQRQLIARQHRRGRPPKPKAAFDATPLFPPAFRDEPPKGKVLEFRKKEKQDWPRCSADREES